MLDQLHMSDRPDAWVEVSTEADTCRRVTVPESCSQSPPVGPTVVDSFAEPYHMRSLAFREGTQHSLSQKGVAAGLRERHCRPKPSRL